MGDSTEATSVAALLEKLAALEKRLAELEKPTPTSPNTVSGPPPGPENKDAKDSTDTKTEEEETSTSRVKVVITVRDPDTNEPIVKDSKITAAPKDENTDSEKYAFVLKKSVYEKDAGVDFKGSSEIDITNPHLWTLLKKHLGHYPYHIFRDLPVTLNSPFEEIIHHFDELRQIAKEPETQDESENDKKAREDLDLLLDTISGGQSGDEMLDKYFKSRDGYKKQSPETVQFDDLWTVFKPGMLVYGKPFQDQDQVFLVKDCGGAWPWTDPYGRPGHRMAPWELEAWSYDWNDGSFRRQLFLLKFEEFEGHRPLTSLPFYPFEMHEEKEKIRAELINRGKEFRKVCEAKKGSRLFEYKGKSIMEKRGFSGIGRDDNDSDIRSSGSYGDPGFPPQPPGMGRGRTRPDHARKSSNVNGRVMVDYESFVQYADARVYNGTLEPGRSGEECSCSDCEKNTEFRRMYRSHFDTPKVAKAREWEEEQYLLCPPRVLGYILKEKLWAQLQITHLKEPPPADQDNAWENRLKFADDNEKKESNTKATLLDLVRSHASAFHAEEEGNSSRLEVDDIVPGKGKGLVILLYGPPGVGKTLTAETISTATRKPLFSVSVADVGTDPKNVEGNLSRIFALATKWQAILLIDEADVFLESRGRGNAIRSTDQNALVSVFLRVLEYYHGIMFLTTNQIAEFDVAIPSRIHMAIAYHSLNKEQMEAIFFNFLDKLDDRNLIKDYEEIKEWLSDQVYDEKLDGRQIRNIVTTALSLARAGYEHRGKPEKLTKAHLKKAFDNVKNFKRDFRDQLQSYKESQKNFFKMNN